MTPVTTPVRKNKDPFYRPQKLSRADVFGTHKFKNGRLMGRTGGMVAAYPEEKCPVFKDEVPERGCTVVGRIEDYDEIEYWLEYVKGGGCITRKFISDDGYVALRAEHQSPDIVVATRAGQHSGLRRFG